MLVRMLMKLRERVANFVIDRSSAQLLKLDMFIFIKSLYKIYIILLRGTIDVYIRWHAILGLLNVTLRSYVTITFTVYSSSICRTFFIDARTISFCLKEKWNYKNTLRSSKHLYRKFSVNLT